MVVVVGPPVVVVVLVVVLVVVVGGHVPVVRVVVGNPGPPSIGQSAHEVNPVFHVDV